MNRRYIILGLALAVAVVAFDRYFVMPRAETLEESVAVAYSGLKKAEQSVSGPAVQGTEVAAASEELRKLEKGLISEKTGFLAAVRLQDDLSGKAAGAGVRLSTIRTMPAGKAGNYRLIPIYFEGSGDVKQLSDFLRALESGPLLISLDKLSVTITNMQSPKELKFKVQVSGVARP